MAAPFQSIRTKDEDLRLVQQNVAAAFTPLVRSPLADAVMLEPVEVTALGVNVQHKLNRAPRGWLVVDKSAAADVWSESLGEALDAQLLRLVSSATATVTLVVF